MTWPASDVTTTDMDAGTDSPASARSAIKDLADKFNLLRNHVSAFVQGFLTAASAADARAALGVVARRGVTGLRGNRLTTNTLTLSVREALLMDNNGAWKRHTAAGSLNLDISVAGPAAGGRDQAGAFAAGATMHVFLISNGATLSLIGSTAVAAITTGPTLPSGYTFWAYAFSLKLTTGSPGIIVDTRIAGSRVFFGQAPSLMLANSAGAWTQIPNVSTYVPADCASMEFSCVLVGTAGGAALAELAAGNLGDAYVTLQAGVAGHYSAVMAQIPSYDGVANVQYRTGANGQLQVYLCGYSVYNGDCK